MNLFLDTEFTGLSQDADLISLAIIPEDGDNSFYAEFTDYPKYKINEWLRSNVIENLLLKNASNNTIEHKEGTAYVKGNAAFVLEKLKLYLAQFEQIEFWADVPAYDWVLFCELFGGAREMPSNIFYIPFDLATFLRMKNFKADENRETLLGVLSTDYKVMKHNALWDANISRLLYLQFK